MTKKKQKSPSPQNIWQGVKFLGKTAYHILCAVLMSIYHFLKLLFRLLQILLFGISSFIAANALLILAISLSVYLLSASIGLTDSEAFQTRRDAFIETQFSFFDEYVTYKRASSDARKEGYKLTELTDFSCNEVTNCSTPEEYLIQSNCPYTSICLQNRCAVVCPKEFRQ